MLTNGKIVNGGIIQKLTSAKSQKFEIIKGLIYFNPIKKELQVLL